MWVPMCGAGWAWGRRASRLLVGRRFGMSGVERCARGAVVRRRGRVSGCSRSHRRLCAVAVRRAGLACWICTVGRSMMVVSVGCMDITPGITECGREKESSDGAAARLAFVSPWRCAWCVVIAFAGEGRRGRKSQWQRQSMMKVQVATLNFRTASAVSQVTNCGLCLCLCLTTRLNTTTLSAHTPLSVYWSFISITHSACTTTQVRNATPAVCSYLTPHRRTGLQSSSGLCRPTRHG